MINRIIDFSVHNKIIVFIIVAAACMMGWWSMQHLTLDAVPDLTDTQVIIYSRWDRSPDIMEDQVTYPIVTAMVGAPRVKSVRGFSDFGYSYVYVIFEDGTDIYWARSRTLEYLSGVLPRLPAGVRTELGPDATGLGWVFQYALVDPTGKHSLEELRSYQDWYLRYYLKAVPGVAEVAPVGGFVRQYQVNVDPNRLQAYNLSINQVVKAVAGGNQEVGGRLIEFGGTEYMVRGRGYARSLKDFENIVLTASPDGTPIRVKDVGRVVMGPDLRRGVTDLDGTGEVVSGIIVMREGQNALDVIDRVKAKIKEIEPGLPAGVQIVPIYDRSDLIQRAIGNMKSTLVEVLITVSLVILIFLWHFPSAIIPVITIPVAVLISFIPFRMMGVTANIMSLGGIIIAVGALVDAAIVMVEQVHKKLEKWNLSGRLEDYQEVIIKAVKEVAGPSFFALAGDRGGVSAGAEPRVRGRPDVQAPGLHQEPRHAGGRGPGHHPGPGPAAPVHPRAEFQLPAPLVVPDNQRRGRGHHLSRGKAPHQPALDPVLRTVSHLVAAPEMVGDRRGPGPGAHHAAGLCPPGLGIYAAPGGRRHSLHALHHARDLHRRGPETAPGHRPHHQGLPRGGPGPGQGGPGRDLNRPGPGVHAGDVDHAQTQSAMAPPPDPG